MEGLADVYVQRYEALIARGLSADAPRKNLLDRLLR
jgi:hypothetical protein